MTIRELGGHYALVRGRARLRGALLAAAMVVAGCSAETSAGSASLGSSAPGSGLAVGSSSGVFTVIGPEGGPFEGGRRTYTLLNSSNTRTITWEVEATQPWLAFSDQGGMLAPGASIEVDASLVPAVADSLESGEYPADIIFRESNLSAGSIYLAFLLRVLPGPDDAGLWVTPEEDVQVNAELGGSFSQTSITYTLQNTGAKTLDWTLSVDQPWLVLPGAWTGTLAAGTSRDVVLGLDPAATSYLNVGMHLGLAHFQVTSGGPSGDLDRRIELTLTEAGDDERVEEGLIALYDFESPGAVVRDESEVQPQHDLLIEDLGAVQWLPGVLRIEQPTRVLSQGPATKIVDACKLTNAITLEAWITPENVDQEGPARIATISDGAYERDVTLGQGLWDGQPSDTYNVRLRSTETDANGMPQVNTPAGSAKVSLQHVVYTRTPQGLVRFYIDGALAIEGTVAGDMSNWDGGHQLALANELGAWRPWLGDLHLIAIYDRALSEAEVNQNLDAGTGDAQAGHLVVDPATNLVISGLEGSDFPGSEKTYTTSNPGPETIVWSASVSEPWIYIDSTGGVLEAGAEMPCTVHLDVNRVKTFSPGLYVAEVHFSNDTNGLGDAVRQVRLTVQSEGGGGGEKPGPHNTGPTDPDLLVPTGSLTITEHGALVENVLVTGMITIKANNVTIRNFRIVGNGKAYGVQATFGYTGAVLEDGEILGSTSAGLYGAGFTARRLEIHEMGADGMKCRGDNLIEGCWIHHLGLNDGAHADGNQTRAGSNITLKGNFFDMPVGIGGGYKSNACSINQATLNNIDGLTMDSNWLNGGNFTVYFTAPTQYGFSLKNCALINNRFGRDFNFGVLSVKGNVQNFEVSGNVWDDSGELMDINDQH